MPDFQFSITPIGFIKTPMQSKFQAPHQPTDPLAQTGYIELLPDNNFEAALHDLIGFDRIWLLWIAHKNKSWRPKVLPPRGSAKRRGVFATRSVHRPNPIGLTAVRLVGVQGRRIEIGECDLVDGTPIVDIKPYIPSIDAFPSARSGWLDDLEIELSKPKEFLITVEPLAREQLDWLTTNWNVDFFERARALLERDPTPHRSRRISKRERGDFKIGCGPWRLIFRIEGKGVNISHVACGYPKGSLFREGYDCIVDRDAQIAFYERWGEK